MLPARHTTGLLLLLASLLLAAPLAEAKRAYRLPNGHWVQDYYDPVSRHFLDMVVRAHFNKVDRRMHQGRHRQAVGDLSYTLEHLPNHPLALRKATAICTEYPEYLSCSRVDGWFQRAMRFVPDDANVQLLFGIHLQETGHPDEALQQYLKAITMRPESADAHYNAALIYLQRQDYQNTLKHAKLAYQYGHRAPGLKEHLKTKGLW